MPSVTPHVISPPDPSPSYPRPLPGAAPAAVTAQGTPDFSAVVVLQISAPSLAAAATSPPSAAGLAGAEGVLLPQPGPASPLPTPRSSALAWPLPPPAARGADESRAWCLIYNHLGTQLWQGRARQEMWQCPGSCAHTAYQRMLERLSNARGGLSCFIPAEDKLLYYRDTCLGEGAESWILELVQPGTRSSWSLVQREPG